MHSLTLLNDGDKINAYRPLHCIFVFKIMQRKTTVSPSNDCIRIRNQYQKSFRIFTISLHQQIHMKAMETPKAHFIGPFGTAMQIARLTKKKKKNNWIFNHKIKSSSIVHAFDPCKTFLSSPESVVFNRFFLHRLHN